MKCFHCRREYTPVALVLDNFNGINVRLCLACHAEIIEIERNAYNETQQRVIAWWNEEKQTFDTK